MTTRFTSAVRKTVDVSGQAPAFSSASTAATFTAPGLTDPLAAQQWHLSKIGDLATVWEDYTGRGVKVGVYDSGIQYAHWDLAANYDASLHIVVDGRTYDGNARAASGPHGTAVAGIIAAARNGEGGVGIAYDASLTGVNIFDPFAGGGRDPGIFINAPDPTRFFAAMAASAAFDVVNHSWGSSPNFDSASSRTTVGTFDNNVTRTVTFAAETGRGGLGTISVAAAGNFRWDGQGDGWKTDRHVTTVAAFRELDGSSSFYSARGAHLLVSAPSDDFPELGGTGMVTTDLLQDHGYNTDADPGGDQDYTDVFGGTSAATPVVTGVVALMLDANEELGWRDVKNILAASATAPVAVTSGPTSYPLPLPDGSTRPILLNESVFEMAGRDAGWNGGAMHYSTDYGFGGVNAHGAVRMAEVWSLFGAAKTSANEESYIGDTMRVSLATPAGDFPYSVNAAFRDFLGPPVGHEFTITADMAIEHVDLTIDYTNGARGPDWEILHSASGLRLKLTAPDGTEGFVDTIAANGSFGADNYNFTFGFEGFRGVNLAGTWKVEFENPYQGEFTVINSIRLQAYGAAVTVDDLYTYTDEYFAMAAIAGEDSRRTLSDTDGGVDWINAAAVTADVELSLVEGATTRFDGRDAFTIAAGSRIEHAVTGDGDDRLIGNVLDNRLYGMRGDDWLNGGAGNDTLFGGQGDDVFAFDTAGVSGNDVVLDWSAGDRIATSKMLRGADQNGLLTVGSNALLLLDGMARGDTAELAGQGGAVLQVLGKSDGYWWYSYVSGGDEDFVDGRVTELALGQTGRPANDTGIAATALPARTATAFAHDAAFYLYDTMGDAMASGVQTWA